MNTTGGSLLALDLSFGETEIDKDKSMLYFEVTCRPRELLKMEDGRIKFADDLTLDEAKLIIEQLIVNAKKVLYPVEVDRET